MLCSRLDTGANPAGWRHKDSGGGTTGIWSKPIRTSNWCALTCLMLGSGLQCVLSQCNFRGVKQIIAWLQCCPGPHEHQCARSGLPAAHDGSVILATRFGMSCSICAQHDVQRKTQKVNIQTQCSARWQHVSRNIQATYQNKFPTMPCLQFEIYLERSNSSLMSISVALLFFPLLWKIKGMFICQRDTKSRVLPLCFSLPVL